MSVEAVYGLNAHFQLVSGFTNDKCETIRKIKLSLMKLFSLWVAWIID